MAHDAPAIGADGEPLPVLAPGRDPRLSIRVMRLVYYVPVFTAPLILKTGEPTCFGITIEFLMRASAASIVAGVFHACLGCALAGFGRLHYVISRQVNWLIVRSIPVITLTRCVANRAAMSLPERLTGGALVLFVMGRNPRHLRAPAHAGRLLCAKAVQDRQACSGSGSRSMNTHSGMRASDGKEATMGHSRSVRRRATVRLVSSALVLLLFAGCASTQIGAQWVDPQYAKQSLQGTAVLVVCEAQDTTLRLLCESKFAARLAALGAKPMSESTQVGAAPAGAAPPSATPGGEASSTALRAAAKEAGARSVLQVSLRPDYSAPNATPSFSFGIGGFGGSRSGVGGGVGVAVPVGTASGAGMAGSSTLVDVASGRVIWSARATAPASSDMSAQVDELAAVSINALQQAGLF